MEKLTKVGADKGFDVVYASFSNMPVLEQARLGIHKHSHSRTHTLSRTHIHTSIICDTYTVMNSRAIVSVHGGALPYAALLPSDLTTTALVEILPAQQPGLYDKYFRDWVSTCIKLRCAFSFFKLHMYFRKKNKTFRLKLEAVGFFRCITTCRFAIQLGLK